MQRIGFQVKLQIGLANLRAKQRLHRAAATIEQNLRVGLARVQANDQIGARKLVRRHGILHQAAKKLIHDRVKLLVILIKCHDGLLHHTPVTMNNKGHERPPVGKRAFVSLQEHHSRAQRADLRRLKITPPTRAATAPAAAPSVWEDKLAGKRGDLTASATLSASRE